MRPALKKEALTLVDGGVLSNYPIDIFDRQDDQPSRWPTLGVKLSAKKALVEQCHPINNSVDILRNLIATMRNAHDNLHIDDKSVQDRTVFVDTTGVSATDFTMLPATRDSLFDRGQSAAEGFLKDWNWELWKKEHRR